VHERYNDRGTVSTRSPMKMRVQRRRWVPAARRKDPRSFTAAWHWV